MITGSVNDCEYQIVFELFAAGDKKVPDIINKDGQVRGELLVILVGVQAQVITNL